LVDIFDEISEDLRHERALAWAKRYGALVLGACLLILLGVAGQQGWAWYQTQQAQKAANAYLALTAPIDAAQGNLTPAQRQSDITALTTFAAGAPEGYKILSLLRAAGLNADAGQTAPAEALWNVVAQDTSADPLLRDLANLLWAQHALGTAPDADVLARLAPLAADGNPYHGLARETQALVYLHEGNTDQAKALFTEIAADTQSPEGVRNRAQGLLAKLNG
jgi:hypothetical protein